MNLIERRRQMMMSKSLPYDAEIEYLEKRINGQYIDTLIKGKLQTKLVVVFRTPNISPICGVTAGSSGYSVTIYSSPQRARNRFGDIYYDVVMQNNTINTVSIDKDSLVVNNTTYHESCTTDFITDSNILLFGRYTTDSPVNGLRIYSSQIYENNILVRDFIPVRVGQVGYMYDKVSGQLFGNQGTGNFVLGADKV